MLLIEYPTCTTCIKAKKWLDAQGLMYTARNIKEQRPSYDELNEWYPRSGLPLKRLFNTSGTVYRDLGLKEKLPGMSEDEQLHLLSSNGMLVRRPIVVTDDMVLFGFNMEQWAEALLSKS